MRPRKLQIFVSSTYEDLIDYRLAAMEAILAAGHIPAAMEQFSPGDDTAWERIQNWIDQSDAYILILGGRYGSIEPTSGKSYTQLEYEYAVAKKKPLFALVIHKDFHEARVKADGFKVDERNRPDLYRVFYDIVTKKLCGFWSDKKDIKNWILQKLPEWAQRDDLVGWVRGDEAVSPDLSRELAKLQRFLI
jgi:nucleoside 2-deoxyribosyltransferase